MMLPISVASSSGSPSFSAWVLARSLSRKLSKMSACRNNREPAVQDWLCRVKRIPAMTPSTTQSQRYRHDPIRRGAHDQLADLGRSGERQLSNHGMMRERSAAFLAETGE